MKDLIVKRLVGLVFFLLLFIIFLPALFKAEGVKDIQKISFGKPSEIIIKNKDMLKQSEDLVNLKENNEFSSTEKIIDINKITQAKSEFKAWIVRVGSFKVLDNAEKLNEKLQKKNFRSYIVKKEKNSEFFYYVNVGPFNKSKDIENIYLSLSKIKELKGIYIIEKNIK
jgi:cell division septation protein DedD|tara:strand:- start:448 stop:954 length:507 start_codon:yes stop_codon:yes gene_type:complete